MRGLAIVLSLVACHSPARPDGASGGGSSSVGAPAAKQDAAGSTAPTAASSPDAAVAQPAATAAPAVEPPPRASDSADRISAAERALVEAIASTNSAKTRQQACASLGALERELAGLDLVTPPSGLERAFSAERDEVTSMLGAIQSQDCTNGALGANEIGADLGELRKELAKLRQIVIDATAAGPQPSGPTKRSKADAARMVAADRALLAAAERAKWAKTLSEACSGLGGLGDALGSLNFVTPPPGSERAFSESRDGLGMLLGVMVGQRCDASSGADADLIRDNLGELRKRFGELQGIGAKP